MPGTSSEPSSASILGSLQGSFYQFWITSFNAGEEMEMPPLRDLEKGDGRLGDVMLLFNTSASAAKLPVY